MKMQRTAHCLVALVPLLGAFACDRPQASYPAVDAFPDAIHQPTDHVVSKGEVLSIKTASKEARAKMESGVGEVFDRIESIADADDANWLMDQLKVDYSHPLINGRWQDIVIGEIPRAALHLLDGDPAITATLESRLVQYVDAQCGRSSPDREIVTARALASVASTPDSRAMTLAKELRDHAIAWSKRRGERGEIDRVEKNSKRVDRFAELRTNSQLREKVIKDRRRSALRKLKGITDPEY